MPSEREFLKQRLALVESQLVGPDSEYVYVGEGKARRRTVPAHIENLSLRRERRLLRKLQAESKEGHVLARLCSWRSQLSAFLSDHLERYRDMQEAHDNWWQLPPYKRETVPEPPQPPPPRFTDRSGYKWMIDDRFLALLDDLIDRLQKWLRTE